MDVQVPIQRGGEPKTAAPGALRLDLLEAFVALAEELQFTRAARRLFLSQSGLSRRISTLEALFGTELVVRTTRSVELTAPGEALLPHAQTILMSACAARDATRRAGTWRNATQLDPARVPLRGRADIGP
jgi:DNA-binding transcriptional LysR family regulator